MITLTELQERLDHEDEVTILELCDVSSEELVELLLDRIEERMDYIIKELELETDDE